MASYHYSFGVHESRMRYSGEDDQGRLTTVKMLFWKLMDESSAAAIEMAGGIECRYVHLDEAQNDVLDLSDCLGRIGIPQECHAMMIYKLMQYIQSEVVIDGRRRYESETVVMDIVEASDIAQNSVIEEWSLPRRWNVIDMRQEYSEFDAVRQLMEEYVSKMVLASEAAILSLEKVQQGEEALSCAICMDDDEEDEELGFSRMPCKHEFHTMCIQIWLRISSSCPLCRYTLPC